MRSRSCNADLDSDNKTFPPKSTQPAWTWECAVVAVPKRRKSPSRQGMRRSHDFLVAPALNICPQCKLAVPPHKVCDLVEECGNVQRGKPHNPMAKKDKKDKEKPKP